MDEEEARNDPKKTLWKLNIDHYHKNKLISGQQYEGLIKTDDDEAKALTIDDSTLVQVEELVDEKFSGEVQSYIRYRFCSKCQQVKPPRAHHCAVCKRCVMRMDHHCPWVGNCIGFRTHKFFWTFLLYSWLGTTNCAIAFLSFKSLVEMQ